MSTWKRPENHPFPRVWRRLPGFVIQDLPPEREEEALEHMAKFQLRDEPISKGLGLANDKESLDEFLELFRTGCFPYHLTLICVEEATNKIAGVNMLRVVEHKSAQEEYDGFIKLISTLKGKHTVTLLKIMSGLYLKGDPYKHFGVELMLDSFSLSIDSSYRKRGLGQEMMWARLELAKEFGISVQKSIYTSNYSQRIAILGGGEVFSQINYDEVLNPDGSRILGDMSPHTCAKLIAGRVPAEIPPPRKN